MKKEKISRAATKLNSNAGYTLVEMITTMAIMALLCGALYTLFFTGGKTYEVVHDSYEAQNEARIAMSYMTVKIRQNDAVTLTGGTAVHNIDVIKEPSTTSTALQIKFPSSGDYWRIYAKDGKLVETTGAAFTATGIAIAEGIDDVEFTTSGAINGDISININISYKDGINPRSLNETVTLRADGN